MMWIRLRRDWDWRERQFTVAYRAGQDYNVPRKAADKALAAKAAVRLTRANKNEPFNEVDE